MSEMLEHTFLHLPSLGPVGERKLWTQGVLSWADLAERGALLFSPGDWEDTCRRLDESRERLAAGDYRYFLDRLPRTEHWRVISPANLDRIAYLDIETTGMGYPPMARSTSITFYYRGQVLQEIDEARKYKLIREVMDECMLLSTFFGQGFDLPFLSAEYGFRFEVPHLDLCFWLKRHGFKGGLKKVQTRFPEIPRRESEGMDGSDAVKLWRMHERGVPGALETLLTYNAEDTVVLEPLLINAFNLEVAALQRQIGPAALEVPLLSVRNPPQLSTRVRSL